LGAQPPRITARSGPSQLARTPEAYRNRGTEAGGADRLGAQREDTMADVEAWSAEVEGTVVRSMDVRFKGTGLRRIDRATALRWIEAGHSLVAHGGAPHHPHRGASVERVEVDGAAYLRTDGAAIAGDAIAFPRAH
jgi:hypothetical protein